MCVYVCVPPAPDLTAHTKTHCSNTTLTARVALTNIPCGGHNFLLNSSTGITLLLLSLTVLISLNSFILGITKYFLHKSANSY